MNTRKNKVRRGRKQRKDVDTKVVTIDLDNTKSQLEEILDVFNKFKQKNSQLMVSAEKTSQVSLENLIL